MYVLVKLFVSFQILIHQHVGRIFQTGLKVAVHFFDVETFVSHSIVYLTDMDPTPPKIESNQSNRGNETEERKKSEQRKFEQ